MMMENLQKLSVCAASRVIYENEIHKGILSPSSGINVTVTQGGAGR